MVKCFTFQLCSIVSSDSSRIDVGLPILSFTIIFWIHHTACKTCKSAISKRHLLSQDHSFRHPQMPLPCLSLRFCTGLWLKVTRPEAPWLLEDIVVRCSCSRASCPLCFLLRSCSRTQHWWSPGPLPYCSPSCESLWQKNNRYYTFTLG